MVHRLCVARFKQIAHKNSVLGAEEEVSQTSSFHWLINPSFFHQHEICSDFLFVSVQSSRVEVFMHFAQRSWDEIDFKCFSYYSKWRLN